MKKYANEIKNLNTVKGDKRIIPFMRELGYSPKNSYCKGDYFQGLFVENLKSKVGLIITCNCNTIIDIEPIIL